MATPLGPEKYGRINFSLGRWTTMGQNASELVLKHAKDQVGPVRFFLRSLLRPWESLFWRSSSNLRKKYKFGYFGFLRQSFHICYHQYFSQPSLTTVTLSVITWKLLVQKNVILIKIRSELLYFLSQFYIFSFQWPILLESLSKCDIVLQCCVTVAACFACNSKLLL